MISATQIVQDVRRDLEEIDRQIRHHPYPNMLARGQVSREALRAFPGHQYHIVTSDLRSLSLLVQRFGDTVARDFLMGVVEGERQGIGRLLVMAKKLGLVEEDLRTYQVTAEGFAYTTFMAYQALYASVAEFVMGLLVNFAAWGHNCARMSAALRQAYGFTEAETGFLDAFADMPAFDDVAVSIIQEGLDRGVEPTHLGRGARLFQAYEKMFWDVMAQIARRE